MKDAVLIVRVLFTAVAVLCYPLTAAAQMGIGGLNGFGAGGYPTGQYSTDQLSSGFPGASYTPFERLRVEARNSRKHAFKNAEPIEGGDEAAAKQPLADKIDTDEADVHETAFRVRTTRVYPQPSLAVATQTFQPIYLSGDTARERRIRKKLDDAAGKMDFTETPLRDVVARIRELHDIPVQIDAKALEDAGLNLNVPITRDIADVSLRSALRLLLGDLYLTHVVVDDVLMITTKDKAAENLQVVFYPVPWGHDLSPLIDVVQNTVSPHTWNVVGGPGVIQRADRFLCVCQTEEVHDEVRHFLERLIEAEFVQVEGSEITRKQTVVTRIHPVNDPKVLGDLAAKLAGICNTALGEDGDPAAKVFVVSDRLVVQSASRAFHVYATDVVTAFNGVETTFVERFESQAPDHQSPAGGGMGGGPF